jgi:hypothetical protein
LSRKELGGLIKLLPAVDNKDTEANKLAMETD